MVGWLAQELNFVRKDLKMIPNILGHFHLFMSQNHEESLTIANDTNFGLTASVYTQLPHYFERAKAFKYWYYQLEQPNNRRIWNGTLWWH